MRLCAIAKRGETSSLPAFARGRRGLVQDAMANTGSLICSVEQISPSEIRGVSTCKWTGGPFSLHVHIYIQHVHACKYILRTRTDDCWPATLHCEARAQGRVPCIPIALMYNGARTPCTYICTAGALTAPIQAPMHGRPPACTPACPPAGLSVCLPGAVVAPLIHPLVKCTCFGPDNKAARHFHCLAVFTAQCSHAPAQRHCSLISSHLFLVRHLLV